jgi:hypothetical protein
MTKAPRKTVNRRPSGLPDFERPPLYELVLSIQFARTQLRNVNIGGMLIKILWMLISSCEAATSTTPMQESRCTLKAVMSAEICFTMPSKCFLKSDLAKNGESLKELRRMGHNLKKLWRAYKRNHPNAALSCHDRTVNRLDKHEDLRYPDPVLGAIGVSLEWSGEPGEMKTYGGLRSPKQYAVVVGDIDDLIADPRATRYLPLVGASNR